MPKFARLRLDEYNRQIIAEVIVANTLPPMHEDVAKLFIEVSDDAEPTNILQKDGRCIPWTDQIIEKTYIENRKEAYPRVTDQLDMLWHAMDIGEMPKAQDWYDTIAGIKEQYPNPESVSDSSPV